MIQGFGNPVEQLNNYKVTLTVPLVSKLLLDGNKPADIARACNVTDQWVSKFIKKHYDEILAVVDPTDRLLALKSKHIASRAIDKINNILAVDSFDKKDLVALNITAGTQIDKHRLLTGQATQIVSMAANDANMAETLAAIKASEARIKALTGDIEVEGKEVIDV